jgi:hypothetical protein
MVKRPNLLPESLLPENLLLENLLLESLVLENLLPESLVLENLLPENLVPVGQPHRNRPVRPRQPNLNEQNYWLRHSTNWTNVKLTQPRMEHPCRLLRWHRWRPRLRASVRVWPRHERRTAPKL